MHVVSKAPRLWQLLPSISSITTPHWTAAHNFGLLETNCNSCLFHRIVASGYSQGPNTPDIPVAIDKASLACGGQTPERGGGLIL
jgi:hypothetical protein